MATNSHLEDCRHCDGGRKVGPTLRSSTSGENNTISLCLLNCENGIIMRFQDWLRIGGCLSDPSEGF